MNGKAIKKLKKLHNAILFDVEGRALYNTTEFKSVRPVGCHNVHIMRFNPLKVMKRRYIRNGGGEQGLRAAELYAESLVAYKIKPIYKKRKKAA